MSFFKIKSPILKLAVPMILSNLTVPLVGLVDTAVMGHLHAAYYLGAVGVGATIFNFLYWGFGFLRMGTTGIIAQARGRNDHAAICVALMQALFIALTIALLLILFQFPIAHLAFKLINAHEKVTYFGKLYFHYRIWAAPATLANYALIGWFIGMHNTRIPLAMMLVSNIIGIIFDLLLVYGLGMTTSGVALAAVLAQYSGLAIGLYFVAQTLKEQKIIWHKKYFFELKGLKHFFHLNKDIFIRTIFLISAYAFFTRQSAQFTPAILAANMILLNFQNIMAYALDGFANAAEALVGHAIGQKSYPNFINAVKSSGLWSIAIAANFSLLYLLFGKYLVNALTSIEAVRAAAYPFLIWAIISPLVSVASFWFDGIFVGATRSKEMRNAMVLAIITYLIAYWLLRPLDNHGLWIALLIYLLSRGFFMFLYYIPLQREKRVEMA